VEKHGLGRAVVLTGPVPHERIPAYLNCIDIAVQPAANEYCCPMKIVEYMGLAKAIVAPRQENIEELLADGEDALLFQPGDSAGFARALGRLISDRGLRHKLGQQAFETLQRRGLLWTHNAERVVEIVTGEARGSRATGVDRAAAV
jgi:glycosyltransferase involved in cell wall biosynthesis